MKVYVDTKNCSNISYNYLWIWKGTKYEEISLHDELNEQKTSIQLIIHFSLILFSNVDSIKTIISKSSGELELGDNVNRAVEFKSDNVKIQVNGSLVGLLVAGAISNNAMTGRTQETSASLDDYPDLRDMYIQLSINIRDYDDPHVVEYHLCFIDSSLSKNNSKRYHRTLTATDSLISSSNAHGGIYI